MSNDFKTNAEKSRKKYPSKKLKVLLNLSIFLLLILSLVLLVSFYRPDDMLVGNLIRGLITFVAVVFTLIMLVIKFSEKPSWEILSKAFKLMAIVFLIYAFGISHFTPNKASFSGLDILSFSSFTLIDGFFLLLGAVTYTFALIFEEGREMENELEEIL